MLRTTIGSIPWRSRSQHDLGAKSCPDNNFTFLKSDFTNISQKWSPYWDDMSPLTFGLLPWRSRSQHDLAAKSCPANKFVVFLSRILQIFHRNDHHIETTCREQHLGWYLKGQGHSMTLQQKRVWPITLLFEVGFYNYLTEMITILRWCVTTLPIVWLCACYAALY